MTQTHPHALPNLFDLLRVDGPDLAMDVAGGNPYSPVWICRLEPNDGNNVWRRFERAAKWGSDPAAITSFENYGVLKDEYRTLSSALVAALTNEDFLIRLDAAQSDDERRELTEGFVREHKILTWGGHGFLMNAGVLSLAAYDDWEKSHFFYGPESLLKCSVKDAFLASGIQSLKEYRERATQVFTAHVQARLRRYQPRLILCQGRKGSKDYLRLFLSEWERKPFLRYGGGGFPSRRFELYFHEETGTVVAICNVLKERKNAAIRLEDIARFARVLRQVPALGWLRRMRTVPRRSESYLREGLPPSDYEALLRKMREIYGYEEFCGGEFFKRAEVSELLKRRDGEGAFFSQLAQIRPQGEKNFFRKLHPTRAERFLALLAWGFEEPILRRSDLWEQIALLLRYREELEGRKIRRLLSRPSERTDG